MKVLVGLTGCLLLVLATPFTTFAKQDSTSEPVTLYIGYDDPRDDVVMA